MGSITKTKTGYRAIVRLGKYRNNPIQKCFKKHKDAKLFIRNKEALITNNKYANKRYPTLEEAFERYLTSVSSKKKTYYYEQKIIGKFIREIPFVNKTLEQLTTEDFSKYRDEYLQNHKISTWLRNLNILKHLWKVARFEWSYELKEIFNFARVLEKPQARFRRLSNRESILLLKGNHTSNLMKSIISIALDTGLRMGEILNIRQEHILERTLIIPIRKNGQINTQIPLKLRTKDILLNSKLPFPIKPEGLKSAWKRLCMKYEIRDLHFHDLRHEALSMYLEKGLSIQEVKVISGHRDINTLMKVYANLNPARISLKLNDNEYCK